jgi:hypothetical protein
LRIHFLPQADGFQPGNIIPAQGLSDTKDENIHAANFTVKSSRSRLLARVKRDLLLCQNSEGESQNNALVLIHPFVPC